MRDVVIAGVGMTAFGKIEGRDVRSMAEEATTAALGDAGVQAADVSFVAFANGVGGLVTGQEMIRGQAALRRTGLLGATIINVENACASSASAAHLAWMAVASGQAEVAVAIGSEQLSHPDKTRTFEAIGTAIDLSEQAELARRIAPDDGADSSPRSLFMDIYAHLARGYMDRTDATPRDFAEIVVKSHAHAAFNPKAQYRNAVTAEEVLSSRCITDPLTLLMCSPVGDGAAAVVMCSTEAAARVDADTVHVLASALVSGQDDPQVPAATRAARIAFERSGVGPTDIDVAEVHDAAAPAELLIYEELGLAEEGGGVGLLRSGATRLGGRLPVNTSGGLLSKGHPIGATGCAQLVELTEQLRGRAGQRQVDDARIALAENGGGFLATEPAAVAVHILAR